MLVVSAVSLLRYGGAHRFISDEMTVFSENIRSNFDDVLVTRRVAEVIENLASSVL